jgi:hypothetical protein
VGESAQDPVDRQAPEPRPGPRQRREGPGVVIASLIGLLALLVSAYTAYIQRQQVRAEVWPYLFIAYQDLDHRLSVFNKGMGPALVHGVRLAVDGRPQRDWEHALRALGVEAGDFGHSTFSGAVLAPGETLPVIILPDGETYLRFRKAMDAHGSLDYCYCSTLDECWIFQDRTPPAKPVMHEVSECPRIPDAEAFID